MKWNIKHIKGSKNYVSANYVNELISFVSNSMLPS
ncbi:MAG: hypothetical protein ACD_79C01469G0007 [uncultured bacterium]|nr:MAG: hypothetical protein ACD_79C01469G0007 [uncultured bacterium]